ncbi:MAG: hypothetical protein RM022_000340 [Nostoc sp. EfeVER01]|uniref:hypothetical protein n=1 Tax=Nostoc sp. EfeVER01 TaxID=3075406 RepID=UPI002AD3A1CC|nr:hypothetical protein [Nostoc sp. EfeVER01]MDZ7946683.1 hypothetical protein [Nostoc sp. EfeVER01]
MLYFLSRQLIHPAPRLRGGETKHSFGGVGFFGFNKQSSGHDIRSRYIVKSRITAQFRQGFADLPEQVQEQTCEA